MESRVEPVSTGILKDKLWTIHQVQTLSSPLCLITVMCEMRAASNLMGSNTLNLFYKYNMDQYRE